MGAPHVDPDAVLRNRLTVKEFLSSLKLSEDRGSRERTDYQRHFVSERVPLISILDDLLTDFSAPDPRDSAGLVGLKALCYELIRTDESRSAIVYHMSKGIERER